MRTIKDELDDAVKMFHESANQCDDRYQVFASKYDETGDLADLAQSEYELGRAAGYLAARNQIHQLRALIVMSGADRVPTKGQKVPT